MRPGIGDAASPLSELIQGVHRVAVGLAYVSELAHSCDVRMSLEESAGLTVQQRMAKGDREAIYDAIVEASTELDTLRERIGKHLSCSDTDALGRLAELRAAKACGACTATICSSRWGQKETAATDRCGKERRRIAASKGRSPASQG